MALLVLGIGGACYGLLAGLEAVFRSIVPSGGNARTTSMEPYDLRFRSLIRYEHGKFVTADVVQEWRLRLPRAFVTSEYGSNGAVRGESQRNDGFSANLRILIDKSGSVKSPMMASSDFDYKNVVLINLTNSISTTFLYDNSKCLNYKEYKYYIKKSDSSSGNKSDMKLYYWNSNGWGVIFQIHDSLRGHYPAICRNMMKFLNQVTVSQDTIFSLAQD